MGRADGSARARPWPSREALARRRRRDRAERRRGRARHRPAATARSRGERSEETSPVGTIESSPALQRGEEDAKRNLSPVGTAEFFRFQISNLRFQIFQPSLRDSILFSVGLPGAEAPGYFQPPLPGL